jgi:hypothetical protein
MDEQPTTALVVGASGMLAECVRWCSERFARVVATCHTEQSGAKLRAIRSNVVAVRADWSQPEEWWRRVGATLGDAPVALAVAWMHSTAGDLHEEVSACVADDGLFVRIRGHATVKPEEGELAKWIDAPDAQHRLPHRNERHIVLGWHRDGGGRWLSSDEIGTGVVRLVEEWSSDDDASPVAWVGSVRPWESRPPGWS